MHKDQHTLTDNRVRAIFEDSRGVFWVGTAGDGLHIMDRNNGSFQRLLNDPKNPHKLSRPPVNKQSLYAVDHITFINEDMQGSIWIGTYAGGINRYNPTLNTIEYFGTSGKGSNKIAKNDFWGLLKTKDNLLWASGWEPENDKQVLYKISTLTNRLNYTHLGKGVNRFAKDANGIIFFGTQAGLLRNNNMDGTLTEVNKTFSKKIITSLEQDSLNNLWVSTFDGLYYFNIITNAVTAYKHDDKNINSIASDGVLVSQLSGKGEILIGTNRGMDVLNISTGNFTHYKYNPTDSVSINANIVPHIRMDKPGNIWVGTVKGLNRFEKKTGKFFNTPDIKGSAIFSIFEDSRNNVLDRHIQIWPLCLQQ